MFVVHRCPLYNSLSRAEVSQTPKFIFGSKVQSGPANENPLPQWFAQLLWRKMRHVTVLARVTRTAFAHKKGPARSRPLVASKRPVSVVRRDRATPAKAVVDAGLDGVLVVLEPGADDRGRSRGKGSAAEVVILVFGLGGPAGRKHVFETGADGVTVLAFSIGGKGSRNAGDGDAEIVIVAEREAALAVQQRRTPSVADPARDRAKFVILRGHQNATREKTAIVVVGQPVVLGFRTDHPVRGELIVEAALDAAHEPAAASLQAVVASERAAQIAADIEPGPVIDCFRRGIGWGLDIFTCLQIGSQCWNRDHDHSGCPEQNSSHHWFPVTVLRPSSNNVASVWLLRGEAEAPMAAGCGGAATVPFCSTAVPGFSPDTGMVYGYVLCQRWQ